MFENNERRRSWSDEMKPLVLSHMKTEGGEKGGSG